MRRAVAVGYPIATFEFPEPDIEKWYKELKALNDKDG